MTKDTKKVLKMIILTGFFLFILIYAFFRSYDLIFGVKLRDVSIDNIPANQITKADTKTVEIKGNAKNASKLTLNGREIPIDDEGEFDEWIALLSGYNTVSIVAQDKFGHIDERHYKLIY